MVSLHVHSAIIVDTNVFINVPLIIRHRNVRSGNFRAYFFSTFLQYREFFLYNTGVHKLPLPIYLNETTVIDAYL